MLNNRIKNKEFLMKQLETFTPEQIKKVGEEVYLHMEKTGATIKDAMGIDEKALEGFYSLAYGHYRLGKFSEANHIFQFLSKVDPNSYKFVMGLGASYHQLKNYEEAALGFAMAFELVPDPNCAYYLADCFLQLNLIEEAAEALTVTIEACGEKESFKNLKERASLIKQKLILNKNK